MEQGHVLVADGGAAVARSPARLREQGSAFAGVAL